LAHELAHQWFGNLVTMPWWDDIWLNEAFATWMGNKVTRKLHPEYRVELGELSSAQRAMRLDSLESARSIRQPIETNHDIKNAFDSITYEKGGAVLAMFERWMGADNFREGIRLYLRRHRGATATSTDLLAALDEVSDREVTPPFLSFLNQAGVPLVTGADDASCEAGVRTVQLAQERYFPAGSSGNPDQVWDIPLCIRHAAGTTCASLSSAKGNIELPGCPSWWMPNADGAGYFRFSMSADDWAQLRTRGFRELSDRGRIAVADSVEAAFDSGEMDVEALFPWFSAWVSSPLRQLAVMPMRPLRFLMQDASPPELREAVMAYSGRLYRKRYRQLGWRSRASDSSDTKLLREAVIRFMVMDVRNRNARAKAARLGRSYIGYPSNPKPGLVDAQLAGLVLATAVQEGDEGLFDHLLGLLESSSDATSRSRILSAIGHAESPELSARALDLALDPRLRVNEIRHVLRTQFRNPRTRDLAWTWFTANFDGLASRFGSGQLGSSPWNASSFCSKDAAAEVESFFASRVAELSGGPRNLAAVVEAISVCAKKASVHMPGVKRAFGSR
jgi:alanyl aminopeptidase